MVTIPIGDPPNLKGIMRYLWGRENYSRLARELNVERSTLYRWESGEVRPYRSNLDRLQRLLDGREVG